MTLLTNVDTIASRAEATFASYCLTKCLDLNELRWCVLLDDELRYPIAFINPEVHIWALVEEKDFDFSSIVTVNDSPHNINVSFRKATSRCNTNV